MATITLYKVRQHKAFMAEERGTAWNFEPWQGNTEHYEGETLEEAVFELPEGYEMAEDITGHNCLWGPDESRAWLGLAYNEEPMILGEPNIVLKRHRESPGKA